MPWRGGGGGIHTEQGGVGGVCGWGGRRGGRQWWGDGGWGVWFWFGGWGGWNRKNGVKVSLSFSASLSVHHSSPPQTDWLWRCLRYYSVSFSPLPPVTGATLLIGGRYWTRATCGRPATSTDARNISAASGGRPVPGHVISWADSSRRDAAARLPLTKASSPNVSRPTGGSLWTREF